MTKIVSLIGPTASGKSAVGVEVAKKVDAVILSLDSLSIYKEIDIASAKPTVEERCGVKHFGIDEIYPDEEFNVTTYISLYKKALEYAQKMDKNLLILGGTSFYLHILLHGVSHLPSISQAAKDKAQQILQDKEDAYSRYQKLEKDIKIAKNDIYRLQKWFEFYFETGISKEEYFIQNPPQPVITENIPIYEIQTQTQSLRERIDLRTQMMFETGIIDEVMTLVQKYGKEPKCFKAIGIKEVIEYLEQKQSLEKTIELVSTHTKQLAKRQRTFNRSKFKQRISLELPKMQSALLKAFAN